jgi:thiamine kinase-like enzyme
MKHLGEAETAEEHAAEAAIRANPDWAARAAGYALLCPDVVSPVHRGVESAVWRVEPEGGAASVLKVMREDMKEHFDLEAAVEGARRAGESGAGPALLWADAVSGAITMPLLGEGWRTATLWELQDDAIMAAALDAARRLHAAPPLARRFDVFAEARSLAERAKAAAVDLPPDFWSLETALGDVEAAIAASGADSAPCRNDGVASNVMVGPEDAVLLLDYDRAGMNDPVYDLAVLLVEAHPFDSGMLPAIEHWCGRADPGVLGRCVAYGVVDDLMWALWGALAAQNSPRRHVEFRKYSEWRFLRCRMAVGDPRFEERLRRL